eukprot:scaffold12476_cov64-Attheya_sp.AAC.4
MPVKTNPVPQEEHIDVQDLEHEDDLKSQDKLSFFDEVVKGDNDTCILSALKSEDEPVEEKDNLEEISHEQNVNGTRPLRQMMLKCLSIYGKSISN